MDGPLAPGERRKVRAPLPTAALIAGGVLFSLTAFLAAARNVAQELAGEPLVVRALGATLLMTGLMLARVGVRAAAGMRRAAAVAIGAPMMFAAAALIAKPELALVPYTRGWGVLVAWLVGVPAICALLLSRWRAQP